MDSFAVPLPRRSSSWYIFTVKLYSLNWSLLSDNVFDFFFFYTVGKHINYTAPEVILGAFYFSRGEHPL